MFYVKFVYEKEISSRTRSNTPTPRAGRGPSGVPGQAAHARVGGYAGVQPLCLSELLRLILHIHGSLAFGIGSHGRLTFGGI
eukprot:590180-Pyramimonas_sp.AAC.1